MFAWMVEFVLGRSLGTLKVDLIPVLALLVSDTSRWVTGQLVAVNGGLSLVSWSFS